MNEFHIMPNPDNVPGKVSSGYQRQNNNMYAIQTGIDTTEPYDNGQGVITIPKGGVVDLNGVLFKLTADIVLNKPDPAVCYWVAIEDGGQGTASAKLVTRPGNYYPAKQGCYTFDSNMRVLNWVSLGELANLTEEPIFSQNVKGRWEVPLRKGWYWADLASGKGGGNGNDANGISAGSGGLASSSDRLQFPFFHDGGKPVRVKVGGNAGNGGNGGNGLTGTGNGTCGGGGGGGSGSGEETEIQEIGKTKKIPGGNGGRGGNAYWAGGGGGGKIGGNGGVSSSNIGSSSASSGGTSGGVGAGEFGSGGGGRGGGVGNNANSVPANGAGAGGGGQGLNGEDQPDGAPGGHCYIYPLAG